MTTGQMVALAAGGVGVWWLGAQLGWWGGLSTVPFAPAAPATPAAPGGGTSTGGTAPVTTGQSTATQGLTALDANTFLYSSSVTPAQMQALSSQLNQELQAGQITQILGTSVLSYMLGWGGASAGASQTVFGQTYTFDGTNWNLQPASSSSSSSSSSTSPAVAQLIAKLAAIDAQLPGANPFTLPGLVAQQQSTIAAIKAAGGTVPAGMSAYMPTHPGRTMVHTTRMNYRRRVA